ncbi:MAG: hypothetical protein GF355_05635 [Candidatus Eisenbacteria bacterium]|nr:hypothetical protein [Candidatus Eisenbacteria bacterium]
MAETPDELVWTVRPFSRRPVTGSLVLVLITVLAVGVGIWMENLFWAVFGFLVLFLSLESFFFATTYRLGEDGVEVRKRFSKSFRGWDSFRTIYVDRRGVTLSPYGGRAFLEPYRALRLIFVQNRDTVLDYIHSHVDPEARIVEQS